jgi:hypothetical protein
VRQAALFAGQSGTRGDSGSGSPEGDSPLAPGVWGRRESPAAGAGVEQEETGGSRGEHRTSNVQHPTIQP